MSALRNTIIHGNCIQAMESMPAGSVDFILTDPPYLAAYKPHKNNAGQTIVNDDNTAWLTRSFAQMYRVLKTDAFAFSFYGWPKVDLFFAAWKQAAFRIGGHVVFRKRYASKTAFLQYRHEAAYLLIKGNPAFPAAPLPRCDGLDLHRQQAPPDAEIHSHPQAGDREFHRAWPAGA
jgi:DNA modification methylase